MESFPKSLNFVPPRFHKEATSAWCLTYLGAPPDCMNDRDPACQGVCQVGSSGGHNVVKAQWIGHRDPSYLNVSRKVIRIGDIHNSFRSLKNSSSNLMMVANLVSN